MPDLSAVVGTAQGIRMRVLFTVSGIVTAFALALPLASAAMANPIDTTLNFLVMRNGDQIGTSTVRLHRDGQETTAEISSHVAVKIAYVTVYRFDQSETEYWTDGRLMAMTSTTNHNGTIHTLTAKNRGSALSVDADGKVSEIDPAVVPFSLWNAALMGQRQALNPQDGRMTPVSVVDHGEEQLVLVGRPTTVHHYSIRTSFAQEVWYDQRQRLVKVELHGIDGSTIQYQPG
jgi:hypothetical protein